MTRIISDLNVSRPHSSSLLPWVTQKMLEEELLHLSEGHSTLNFTLQSLQYYYFNIIFCKGKKLKIRSYQEFSHEIQEKIRNNRENQEVLDRLHKV